MQDTIARLRKAQAEDDAQDTENGKETGETWANNDATPKQLRRLSHARKAVREAEDEDLAGSVASALSKDSDDFWGEEVGIADDDECLQSSAFMNGFIEGAEKVWEAAKHKI